MTPRGRSSGSTRPAMPAAAAADSVCALRRPPATPSRSMTRWPSPRRSRRARLRARSPSARLGLKPGDVIVAVGDTKVTSVSDLTLALQAPKAGDKVAITWTSGGVTHTATATTIAGPAN
ncbi:MAG: PDZ domain-containing protein [Actinobacteria bacterium]|nr:MAG: PDZ domain-containing protein [Actinomycetota bacterium]